MKRRVPTAGRTAGARSARGHGDPRREGRHPREHHKHRRRHHKHRAVVHHSAGAAGAPTAGNLGVPLPLAPPAPPAPSPAPVPAVGSPPITASQARRLLWRAGFGPTPGQVGGARRAGRCAGGRLRPHATVRGRDAERPGTRQRRRQAAGTGERVGPRPLLVAGPHGPLRPAARRADDVHLPRLVRELQRSR